MATPKERALSSKCLVVLLQSLVGMETTVELRNECIVQGKIENVDCYMNVDMTDARLTAPNSEEGHQMEQFFVQGQQIRYVHIPDEVDVGATIAKGLSRLVREEPKKVTTRRRPMPRSKSTKSRERERSLQKLKS
ncbi:U7 snRNA-associated Sm-like protein LSm10 [Ornithodoros turicata]|uniref:U7 snRNA-associated Sm-like protein LSm10 n=1 Tax=Ornithodoros turicata TaxID=34597 RepID=UPI00313A2BB2